MSEIMVNLSVRKAGNMSAEVIETVVIREVSVKDVEEISKEIMEKLEDAVVLAMEELGLLENE